MQCSLNFSQDKEHVLEFLRQFPCLEPKSQHELLRCKIGESTATFYKSGKLLLQGEGCEKVKELVLKALEKEEAAIVGIDETGRGESFGPFVVAGVLGKASSLRELRDSKKTKELGKALSLVEAKAQGIAVSSFSSEELSSLHESGKSLNQVEAEAISEICSFFGKRGIKAKVVVDGSPIKGVPKEVSFLVRGDDLNPVIGAASVVARSYREKSKDKGKRRQWGKWGKK
jgi:ribonuclease HII